MRAFIGFGTAFLASCGLYGQPAASPPAFEVASVKLSTPQERMIALSTYPGGRITATNYTLEMLMEEAYSVQNFQISGGPRWIGDERYSIEAKPPASSKSSESNPPYPKWPLNEEQRLMLRALLADRFHLQLHRETKDIPGYDLVVAKNGPKMKESAGPLDPDERPGRIAGERKMDADGFVILPPGRVPMMMNSGDRTVLREADDTMQQFAERLQNEVGRSVIDATGLRAKYDFSSA